MKYRIIIKDGAGVPLGEFKIFRKLTMNKRLNNYGTASFEIPADDPKANSLIALRVYTVHIYRIDDDASELLLWAGEQAIRDGNLNDKGNNWCKITCFDWFEQLFSRYTSAEVTYSSTDAGEIAWSLIDTTQGESDGDFGITEGVIEATQSRDRTYNNQNIGEAIINLANVINGFDFEINTSRVFNVSENIGVDRTNLVLEYGRNIQSIDITEDFSFPVNRAIILGDSGDYQVPLRVERDDAVSQGIYKLREGLLNEMNVSETDTLQEKGDALLRKRGEALFRTSMTLIPSSSPTIADFALGDVITLKVINGVYNIEEFFRIYEWTVVFTENDTEELDLVLGNFNNLPGVS